MFCFQLFYPDFVRWLFPCGLNVDQQLSCMNLGRASNINVPLGLLPGPPSTNTLEPLPMVSVAPRCFLSLSLLQALSDTLARPSTPRQVTSSTHWMGLPGLPVVTAYGGPGICASFGVLFFFCFCFLTVLRCLREVNSIFTE